MKAKSIPAKRREREKRRSPGAERSESITSTFPGLDEQGTISCVIFNHSPSGILLEDENGVILAVNPAVCGFLGYSPGELVGRNILTLAPPAGRAEIEKNLRRLFNGETLRHVVKNRRKDGRVISLRLQEGKITLPGGRDGVLVLSEDVTRQARKEKIRHWRELSERLLNFQEKERKFLARELHDHIGQDLATIKISLQLLGNKEAEPVKVKLEEIVQITEGAIKNLRRISSTLRPESLDDIGLVRALRHEAEYLSAHSGVKISCRCRESKRRLSSGKEIAIFRIAQEALTNVIKHARARNAQIRLIHRGGNIIITVVDDGRGFPTARLKSSPGLGLLGIRERVELVGGELEITSAPGKGTTLSATIPLGAPKG